MLASVLATAVSGNDGARFVDFTEKAGITFEHRHGGGGDKHIMETVGGGASLWDYDGDGDLDIYFLNGAPLPGYKGPQPLSNALYRNDGGRFVDVTAEAGLTESGYSMGCVVADYDNDGDLDVYVTSFGKNRLYRNNGDGTFADVTERAGVADARLGSSAAFGDIEGDGDLDLYVTNYVAYTLENPIYCGNRAEGIHTYCHPNNYEGALSGQRRRSRPLRRQRARHGPHSVSLGRHQLRAEEPTLRERRGAFFRHLRGGRRVLPRGAHKPRSRFR